MEVTLEKPIIETGVSPIAEGQAGAGIKTEAEQLLASQKFAGQVEEKVREEYGVLRVGEQALKETAASEKEALLQTQQRLTEAAKEVNTLFGEEQNLKAHEAALLVIAESIRTGLGQLEIERRTKIDEVEAKRSERQGRLEADRAGEIKGAYAKHEGEWAYLKRSLDHDKQQLAAANSLLNSPEMKAALGVIEEAGAAVERAQFVAEEGKGKTIDEYRKVGEAVTADRKAVNEKFGSNKKSIDEDVDTEKEAVSQDINGRKAKLEEKLGEIEGEITAVGAERTKIAGQSETKITQESEAREAFEMQSAKVMDLTATLERVRTDINKDLGLLARVGETAREIAQRGGDLVPQVEGLLALLDEREANLGLAVDEAIGGLSARATDVSEAIVQVANEETAAARGVVKGVEDQIDKDLVATGQFILNENGVLVQVPLEGRDAILAFTDWMPVAQKARESRDQAYAELRTRIMEIGTGRETSLVELGRQAYETFLEIEAKGDEAKSSLTAARETVTTLIETTKEAFGQPETPPEVKQNAGGRLMAAAGRVLGGLFGRFK